MITRSIKFVAIIFCGVGLYFLVSKLSSLLSTRNSPLISPAASIVPGNVVKTASSDLEKVVITALTDSQGVYGIVIKNFKNGEHYELNEHRVFTAGSLYKLWVAATAYNQIGDSQLSPDQILTKSIPSLNAEFNIPPDSAEMTTGSISLSVKDALHQAITISHNYAAMLLTDKVRSSSVSNFLKKENFNESSFGSSNSLPITTASDISDFFEKLYRNKLLSAENTQEFLNLLKSQTLNDKFPKKLPQGVIVAHKTGEIGSFTHDAGIVYMAKGDYIIVILSESTSPPRATERIASISKAVFSYFEERP